MGRKSALTPEQWAQIERRHLVDGESLNSLATEFGVNESSLRRRKECGRMGASTLPSQKDPSGFVYVISFSDSGDRLFYKIGLTTDLKKRLLAHQCSLPFDVQIVCSYYVADMYSEERLLHSKFSQRRIRGEWFDLWPEELAAIASRSLVGSQ
ncbi:GIY-YIG nuclease family protein [Burkholderia sp. Ax-1719]|uniref:GIY-YIG nuclease family protein n=1 Tax=Burkholderia sp. Ax-1719 TaxID=2608334 RepID=UPI00141FCF06|nr:GIY-YIG nuclease family protein [Burkholderia sp. Ax-1719]NIE67465.1 hypothetical protein [Burkholderia sp. Ax-1719]